MGIYTEIGGIIKTKWNEVFIKNKEFLIRGGFLMKRVSKALLTNGEGRDSSVSAWYVFLKVTGSGKIVRKFKITKQCLPLGNDISKTFSFMIEKNIPTFYEAISTCSVMILNYENDLAYFRFSTFNNLRFFVFL